MLVLNQCGPRRGTDNHSLLSLYYDTRNIKLCHRRGSERREERGGGEEGGMERGRRTIDKWSLNFQLGLYLK